MNDRFDIITFVYNRKVQLIEQFNATTPFEMEKWTALAAEILDLHALETILITRHNEDLVRNLTSV